jgi:GTP cyclohydrolase IA
MNINTAKIESLVRQLLLKIGEDPEREGLLKTPERVAAALAFLTSGYRTDPVNLINGAVFTQETHSMVIVKNIEVAQMFGVVVPGVEAIDRNGLVARITPVLLSVADE